MNGYLSEKYFQVSAGRWWIQNIGYIYISKYPINMHFNEARLTISAMLFVFVLKSEAIQLVDDGKVYMSIEHMPQAIDNNVIVYCKIIEKHWFIKIECFAILNKVHGHSKDFIAWCNTFRALKSVFCKIS